MENFTEHYGLHQWVPEDNFLRSDFNTDFSKIDQAIYGVNQQAAGISSALSSHAADSICHINAWERASWNSRATIYTGTYVGNGESTQIINLGYTPRALLVVHESGAMAHNPNTVQYKGGLALLGHPVMVRDDSLSWETLSIVENGFRVSYSFITSPRYFYLYTNHKGSTYFYLAIP